MRRRGRLYVTVFLALPGTTSAFAPGDHTMSVQKDDRATLRPTGYAAALHKIQEVAQTKATALDLSEMELTSLPPEIWQLTHLKELKIADNDITSLPSEISLLTQL